MGCCGGSGNAGNQPINYWVVVGMFILIALLVFSYLR